MTQTMDRYRVHFTSVLLRAGESISFTLRWRSASLVKYEHAMPIHMIAQAADFCVTVNKAIKPLFGKLTASTRKLCDNTRILPWYELFKV